MCVGVFFLTGETQVMSVVIILSFSAQRLLRPENLTQTFTEYSHHHSEALLKKKPSVISYYIRNGIAAGPDFSASSKIACLLWFTFVDYVCRSSKGTKWRIALSFYGDTEQRSVI